MNTTGNDSAKGGNVKELVERILRSLVDDPSRVQVSEVDTERTTLYEVRVASEDVGRVIGRKGRVVNAIRTIVGAAARHQGKRIDVEVISPTRKRGRDGA